MFSATVEYVTPPYEVIPIAPATNESRPGQHSASRHLIRWKGGRTDIIAIRNNVMIVRRFLGNTVRATISILQPQRQCQDTYARNAAPLSARNPFWYQTLYFIIHIVSLGPPSHTQRIRTGNDFHQSHSPNRSQRSRFHSLDAAQSQDILVSGWL